MGKTDHMGIQPHRKASQTTQSIKNHTTISKMDSAGARSVMSDDMKELTKGKEDISSSVRGHKANLPTPTPSEASKEASREAIKQMGGDSAHYGDKENPSSKSAQDNLEGSRVAN